jgi:ribosomal protein S27AE
MRFDLTRPCKDCPFRPDTHFDLRPERVREILGDTRKGGKWWPAPSFPCHNTVDYSPYTIAENGRSITCHRCGRTSYSQGDVDNLYCGKCKIFHEDAGEYVPPTAQQCAGVMIILHREGRPNDAMQIAERFGLWNPANLDPDAPVYASTEEAIRSLTR